MARLKLGNLAPPATVRSRGSFLIIDGKYGPYAQKWPKPRGRAKTPYEHYHQAEFKISAQWASDPEPVMLQSAMNMAQGSHQVARDYIMMAQTGALYTIIMPDGTIAERYRDVAPNVQLILEQLDPTIGAMIYRNDVYWETLPPSLDGFVLTLHNGKPLWQPATTGSGGIISYGLYDVAGTYTYAIPAGAARLDIYLACGGCGGGSGRRGAAGTNCGGGGGGAGGSRQVYSMRTVGMGTSLALTVGAGGTGGPAVLTDNTNGSNGQPGALTKIVWDGVTFQASPGTQGGGGTTAGGPAGTAPAQAFHQGGAGAAGHANSTPTPPAALSTAGPTGGGGGAGRGAAVANHDGGAAGSWGGNTGMPTYIAAGGIAASKTAAVSPTALPMYMYAGAGGGGGWTNTDGTAGDGADGSFGGGGGGGGGSSLNGNPSGKGGKGGDGMILIIAF